LFVAIATEAEMLGTTGVVDRLRAEGYDVTQSYAAYLLRERIIPSPHKGPGGVLIGLPGNVLALRDELRRRGRAPDPLVGAGQQRPATQGATP
jgi:hypothetical protein